MIVPLLIESGVVLAYAVAGLLLMLVGYGVVDLISLLADDPTAYEDTNPFLVELSGDDAVLYGPTIEQVNADAAPTSPSPTEGTASPEPSGTSATAGPDDAAGDDETAHLKPPPKA